MQNRFYITLLLLLTCIMPVTAQKLTLNAPSQSEVGSRVRVSYTLDSQEFDRIQIDGDWEGLELSFGPAISTSSSFQSINGKTTHSSSTTFTYTLVATKAGTFTIPAASLSSGGKKVKSRTAIIEILPESAVNRSQAQQSHGNGGGYGSSYPQNDNTQEERTSARRRDVKDVYFTATASKKRVFEQEAVVVTYKLYTLLNIDQISGSIPQLDAFHTQEIEQPAQKSLSLERVGDVNYNSVVWQKYVLFPQRPGKFTIPAIDFEAIVLIPVSSIDPYDPFFYGSGLVDRVKRVLRAPAIEIQVDSLPASPANFSGAVGKGFSISGKLTPQKVMENDATTLTLNVSGSGNLRLMSAPKVDWPSDYEAYDAKTTEDVRLAESGNTGSVSYECMAVPRHARKDTIPGVEFCYFDTESKQYRTISTRPFVLDVEKGNGMSSSQLHQEELRELGNDIRHIKLNDVTLVQHTEAIFGSLKHLLGYLVLLVIFAVVVLIFHKRAKMVSDKVVLRGKKAGKAASKRLRNASKLMKAGNANAFYDEVMHALWGYVADKLSLPVTELSKDNVSERLQQRDVDADTTTQFLSVLEECEFARFAPGDPASNMEHLFENASDVINKLDDMIRKRS